jgi:hypothetical protein
MRLLAGWGKTTRLPRSAANKRASNQRKSGRFVCCPRLSADGVEVQGGRRLKRVGWGARNEAAGAEGWKRQIRFRVTTVVARTVRIYARVVLSNNGMLNSFQHLNFRTARRRKSKTLKRVQGDAFDKKRGRASPALLLTLSLSLSLSLILSLPPAPLVSALVVQGLRDKCAAHTQADWINTVPDPR